MRMGRVEGLIIVLALLFSGEMLLVLIYYFALGEQEASTHVDRMEQVERVIETCGIVEPGKASGITVTCTLPTDGDLTRDAVTCAFRAPQAQSNEITIVECLGRGCRIARTESLLGDSK